MWKSGTPDERAVTKDPETPVRHDAERTSSIEERGQPAASSYSIFIKM
jgi:hypothetical protein